jgi:hypothetical protein
MKSTELVADRTVFSRLRAECEKIVDTGRRLPDFVFRRSFAKYFAIEYGHLYKKSFGSFLFQIATTFGEESLNYMAIDPQPESYYQEDSSFGAASFSTLVERYVPVLCRERNVPQLLTGVNVGVFWGSSLKWAISCDRISWEMAVVAVPEKVDVPTISGFRCMGAAELSSYIKSQYHWKLSVASEFIQQFSANYII